AVLTTRSLVKIMTQNFGFQTANRYTVRFDPVTPGYTVERLPGLFRQMEDRFSALPGVVHASLTGQCPMDGVSAGSCTIPQGSTECAFGAVWARASPQFLKSIGTPILRGRDLSEQDTATSPLVAIVSESLAKKLFPDKDPIGQHFGVTPSTSGSFEIVGVYADAMLYSGGDLAEPTYLRPLSQVYAGYTEPIVIRFETRTMFATSLILSFNKPQQDVESLVRKTMAGIDPSITIYDGRTFDTQIANNYTQQRMIAKLISLFGLLALIIASVGLYGVMSYLVARRINEIGIRMALGATRSGVVGMVMRDALVQLGIGLVIGIAGALYAGHLMASQLYQLSSHDPVSLALAACVLTACAIVASFIPARRAASIEPMSALRAE
ncbi:MAG: ABC transporter permease, partial [Acidobacteriaceae bacterium]|nr:ABC transporter permease [Acidobacteriaceae bacterium]